jgi:hypothetical protein
MVLEKVETEDKPKKDKKKKEFIQIVDKLPVQEVRRVEREDVIVNFMTVEEYLTKMANEEE